MKYIDLILAINWRYGGRLQLMGCCKLVFFARLWLEVTTTFGELALLSLALFVLMVMASFGSAQSAAAAGPCATGC
jgi:hypothetical protein